MKKRIFFILAGVSIFFLFVILSYFVHKDFFDQFDFDMTVRLQDHISRRFDEPFSVFSLLGSFEVVSLFIAGFIVLRRKWRGVIVPIFYIGFHVIEVFGKIFVTHPGPPFLFHRYIGMAFPSSYVQPGYSYPSGHAGRTAFISLIVIFYLLKSKKFSSIQKLILICGVLIFDAVMFVSRVYLAEHWTTDVIGGALLGLSLALITEAVF